jgi:signal transduction histidine kinase
MRVVILAPVGRDAALLAATLADLGIETAIAPDSKVLLDLLSQGAGTAIVADEALPQDVIDLLSGWLASQPPWSDIPFIVLTSAGRPTHENHSRALKLEALGNFTLLERPVRPETVQSAARAALRARARQYEIRSRQEALLRANADLEEFAHSASHDLREPLRSIGIFCDLLARNNGPLLDSSGRECIAMITSGVKRMDALLADLLAYAHASSISDEPVEPASATLALKGALENLSGAIQESNAQVTVGELPFVRMRESHLAQLFQNLIGNAIKYRRENEQVSIRLSARRADGHWIFMIADNGIGVPAAYKETIFGIFKRLHTANRYSGTGMGLAICQRIVERYRGRIWVESEAGHGSNFFFTIPA